jgi:hypothetical protein
MAQTVAVATRADRLASRHDLFFFILLARLICRGGVYLIETVWSGPALQVNPASSILSIDF